MFGKSRAFKKVLQDKWPQLYRVCYAWCHDRELAADLVQETMRRCLSNKSIFNQEHDVSVWLFKVMSNCWRDHLRKSKEQVDIDDIEITSLSNIENTVYQNQLIKRLHLAFEQLSDNHRQILTLVVIEDFSYAQVAEILDIQLGTVMSRVCRARERLKDIMQDIDLSKEFKSNLWSVK